MEIKVKAFVTKVTTVVNGEKTVSYSGEKSILNFLKKTYADNGAVYENEFGVSREDAEAAKWHPNHDDFFACDGFKKFIKEKGIITKEETTENISLRSIIEEIMEEK